MSAYNTITKFNYTGTIQSITLPKGKYKLQVYGAEGGIGITPRGTAWGGLGGYSEAEYHTSSLITLYIGIGEHYSTPMNVRGSIYSCYNGGGESADSYYSSTVLYGCGGGATFIALTDYGELKNYLNHKDDLLLVAGGGGGGTVYTVPINGAAGGGLEAERPNLNWWGNGSVVSDVNIMPSNQNDIGNYPGYEIESSNDIAKGNWFGQGGFGGGWIIRRS